MRPRDKSVHKIPAVRCCDVARMARIWTLSFLVAEAEGKLSS